MKNPPFNWPVVRRLVLKDWYIWRFVFISLLLGDLILILSTRQFGRLSLNFQSDSLQAVRTLLWPAFLVWFPHLSTVSMADEKTVQTLTFVRSLPISRRERFAAKFLTFLLPFLVPWAFLLVDALSRAAGIEMPGSGLTFHLVLSMLGCLASYCLVLATCVVRESDRWATALLVGAWILGFAVFWKLL